MEQPESIYNLNVDEFHTYFVGSEGLLVHNDCTEEYIKIINNTKGMLRPIKYLVKYTVRSDGSVLYKLSTKTGEIFEIVYDAKGFPVFDSLYTMTLDAADFLQSRTTHFYRASQDLYQKALGDINIRNMFTESELELFENGLVPERFTWHHHQDSGVMQLVLKKYHEVASHIGGFSIWGPGN